MVADDDKVPLWAHTCFMGAQRRGKGCSTCCQVPSTGRRRSGGLLRASRNHAASARIRCLHEITKIEHATQQCLACTTIDCAPTINLGP